MIGQSPLERRVSDYLAGEATVRAPIETLDAILGTVAVTDQRRSPIDRVTRRWSPLSPSRRLLLVLAAALLVAGAVIVGASLLERRAMIAPSPVVVLVETPAGTALDPVRVVSISGDGQVTALATLTADLLGGTYSEWWADLSPDGHLAVPVTVSQGSTASVIDLRAPDQRAVLPDAEGSMPAFGPDGRLALPTNSGQYAIFDPLTSATTFTEPPSGTYAIQVPFSPAWSAAGDGLIGRGAGGNQAGDVGLVRLDGSFVHERVTPYYDGVGPRRVDASGRFLDCPNCGGDPVELSATGSSGPIERIWLDDLPDLAIADFAWSADGHVWMLLESVAAGPRRVLLVKLVEDHLDRYAEFTSAAGDSDPGTYTTSASIAAMAPNDARIVIRVVPAGGAHDELWSVDPTTRARQRLPDGMVAGWLQPTTLTSARPTTQRLHDSDADLRGVWSRSPKTLTILRTAVIAGTASFTLDARDGQTIAIDGSPDADASCATSAPGTYHWTVVADRLELSVIDDACTDRVARLAGGYRRALPYPDTGSPSVESGRTYLIPDGGVPFTVTPPEGVETTVGNHRGGVVMLMHDGPGGGDGITIVRPAGGVTNVCERHSRTVDIGTSADEIAAYLLGLGPEVSVREVDAISIDRRAARTFEVGPADCPFVALFKPGKGDFDTVGASGSSRVSLVEIDGEGTVVVISSTYGPLTADGQRWTREVLDSIRFEPST